MPDLPSTHTPRLITLEGQIFVDYIPGDPEEFPKIRFYATKKGEERISGMFIIPAGGAKYTFRPVDNPTEEFLFHDLSIHPVDIDMSMVNVVEFEWYIDTDKNQIHVNGLGRGSDAQTYSYTLAIRAKDRIVYRDPEVVNTGGP